MNVPPIMPFVLAFLGALGQSPLRITLDSGMCSGIRNTHDCANAIERAQMPHAAEVSRTEKGLCFALAQSSKCISDVAGPDPTWYSYLGTLAKPHFHVLWATSTEHHEVLLVDGQTGNTATVDDVPVPSPDGETLAVASLDLFTGWVTNRLTILRVTDSTLETVWSVEPRDWGPGVPEWRDDTTVEVPRMELDELLNQKQTGTMKVQWVDDAWTMTPK